MGRIHPSKAVLENCFTGPVIYGLPYFLLGCVNVSKVMRRTRNEDGARLNVMLNGEALEEVDQCKYLGSVIAANGGVEADVHHRVNEGCKLLGALKGVLKNRGLGMNVKKVLYEKVVVPTVMYGSEPWGMKVT